MNSNDFMYYRLRTSRARKRMVKEDFEKKLLRLHKEERDLWKQIRNLGWTELKPPIQQGFERFFILRDDVRRSRQGQFFEKILEKINKRQWSSRKDFKKKRKKFGKKIYVVREQNLEDVSERDFRSNKFSDAERTWFYETLTHVKQSKTPVKVFRFTEPWRFVLRIQPNMITKIRIKDFELEQRAKDIGRFFDFDKRSYTLLKLLNGHTYSWKSRPRGKYKDPFHNRQLPDILNEYHPEPVLNILHANPQKSEGFVFLWICRTGAKEYNGLKTANMKGTSDLRKTCVNIGDSLLKIPDHCFDHPLNTFYQALSPS
jgi:hypothetical protein